MSRGETRRALGTIASGLRALLAVRWVRWTLVVVLLLVGLRAGLEQLLAATVSRLAAQRDLVCEWRDLDLGLFSGRGAIHDLALRPLAREGQAQDPLLDLEYAVFDLDVLALLTGRLSIARAEVDGLDSWWIRGADGAWNVGRHIDAAEVLALLASPEAQESPEDAAEPPQPLDLSPPLAIGALRFQHARLHVLDRTLEPPEHLTFELHAGLSYLDDPGRPARFSAAVLGGDLVEAAHVECSLTWSADAIELGLRAQVGSLHPRLLARFLEPLDVHPVADSIEMRLLADVRLAVIGEARDTLQAEVELSQVHLKADGVEELALDRLHIALDSLSPQSATLPGLSLAGIRGRAALEADGALRVAGFDFTGTRWVDAISALAGTLSGGAPQAQASAVPRWLALLFEPDAQAYAWSLGSLDVRDGRIELTDRTLEPPAAFPLLLDTLHVGEVAHVPGTAARTIPIALACRAPGMAETISVQGSLGPFAPRRSVDLELAVEGIVLASLEGRMQRAGVQRALERGSFRMRLVGQAETDAQGRTAGELALDGIALEDGGSLFGVQSIRARELLIDPAENRLRFGDVEITGTKLAVGRDPSQRFFALGLRTLGFAPGTSDAPSAAAAQGEPRPTEPAPAPLASVAQDAVPDADDEPPPSAPPAKPLRIELGRLAWVDSDVELVDQLVDPPRHFRFDELGFELTNLTLGGDPAGPTPEPARFAARVVAPELLDELTLEGLVRSRPGPLDLTLELALRGRGGRGELVKPYLRALGVEPELANAIVCVDLAASVKRAADGWRAGLALRDASLRDGDRLLLACDELRVEDVHLGAALEIGALALVAPRARLGRDASGRLSLAGLRWIGTAAPGAAPQASSAPSESGPPALALPALPLVRLGSATVEDARISWTDATLVPELATELVLSAALTGLGTDGAPGAFEARLHVPETLERLDLRGQLTLGPEVLRLSLALAGEGVRPGPLARLLPPGTSLASSDGCLAAALDAALEPAAEGGLRARLELRDAVWGERGAEPWLALARAELCLPRIDPAGGVLTLGPLTAEGLRIEAERAADGTLHLFGLALGAPAPSAAPYAGAVIEATAAGAAAAAPARNAPAGDAIAGDAVAGGATAVPSGNAPGGDSRLAAPAPESARAVPVADSIADTASPAPVPPRIELVGDVRLELERLRWRDASLGPGALPLELAATLSLATPLVLVSAEPQDLPPIRWQVEGALAGLVERWAVTGELAPFAPEPHFRVDCEASGVRTSGVIERVPLLADLLAGEVEEGTLAARLTGTLFVRRARPTELGLARPFGAELALEGLEYRDRPGGMLLAGVDAVRAAVERVDQSQGLVHVDTLEIERPRGRIWRADGKLHALGFGVRLEPAPGEPGAASAASAGEGALASEQTLALEGAEPVVATPSSAPGALAGDASLPSTTTPAAGDPAPPSELRIDQILVHGIDFEMRDESVEPAVRLALAELDLELARFTTRALTESRPLRFSGFLGPGEAEGLGSPVFEELAIAGRVSLFPAPSGWAHLSLSGVELPELAPLAATSGLTVEDGALDASVRLRLKGERGVGVDASLVFTDLGLREPQGGFLERTLSLPMALDSALFLLKNSAGEHRFSTGFTLDEGGLSGGQMASAAARAFAEVLARALAAVPLRLLGALLPGGDGDEEEESAKTWTVAFAPGSTELDPALRADLRAAAALVAHQRSSVLVLRHELGGGDAARAEELANPSPEACLELVQGLRQRKSELLHARDALATEAHALFAIGDRRAGEASERLRARERELGALEDALDRLLEILRSDSPRNRHKRTQTTARELAELRLQAIVAELQRSLEPRAHERIEIRAPRFEPEAGSAGGRVRMELRER